MTDFQPLFEPSADSSEFVPLEYAAASEFEAMDFRSIDSSGSDFEPTQVKALPDLGDGADTSEGAEMPQGPGVDAGSLDAGDEVEGAVGESSQIVPTEGSSAESGEAEGGGEPSEVDEDSAEPPSPEIDPAIRAIEGAAHRAGYTSGMTRGKADIAERLKEVEDILAQVEGLRAEYFARTVKDVGRTVTRVVEQVIRRELSASAGDIEGLVRSILTDVQSDDDFVIRVSESDAETIREVHPALLDLVGRDADLRIQVDSRLMSGGTVVETSYGKIDASIEQQLEAFSAGVEAWVTTEIEANDD